jgi:hypothetical protein
MKIDIAPLILSPNEGCNIARTLSAFNGRRRPTHGASWKLIIVGGSKHVRDHRRRPNAAVKSFDEWGQRGPGLVRRDYSWEGVARELLSVFEWVVYSQVRPSCVV